MCIPQQGKTGEGKISPDTGTLAGVRGRTSSLSKNTKEEKAALLYELVTVRVGNYEQFTPTFSFIHNICVMNVMQSSFIIITFS